MVRPLREVLVYCRLVHCRLVHCGLVHSRKLFFLRISDLIGDVSSCMGRLKRVLFACSEKGVSRQYRSSPLCTSCIYQLLASMAVLFQESSTLLYGLCCFLLASKCVAKNIILFALNKDVYYLNVLLQSVKIYQCIVEICIFKNEINEIVLVTSFLFLISSSFFFA